METKKSKGFDVSHRRVWTLLLLRALSKSGLSPCSNKTVHRLLYFGNVLAGVYDFDPPAQVVMRHARGPFYPGAQEDLDWLCVNAYATVAELRTERCDDYNLQYGIYDISEKGYAIANEFAQNALWANESARFLDDLTFAFSTIDDITTSGLEKVDFTYQKPSSEPDPVIHFGAFRDNRSWIATEEIRKLIPVSLRPLPQQSLQLYVRYLEQLAA